MLSYIPISLLYGLPLVPVFILGHINRKQRESKISKLTEYEMGVASDEAARAILASSGLKNIPVRRGEDYSVNEFDEETGQVLLSPETIGQKDAGSVGLAIYAISSLVHGKEDPLREKLRKSLATWEPISFWTVFSILSFGLMANSLPTIICGYVMAVGVVAVNRLRVRLNHKAIDSLLAKLDTINIFSSAEKGKVKEVLCTLAAQG